ncbi:Mannose-6-phosphate isomerase, cupin superfamily [Methanophagales archaeon]|nr:Mannose-6-phosphate isomerase, cupin superfamily [Methanophagales archaeon]
MGVLRILRIGKEEKEVEAGPAIYIPPGVPHGFRAIWKGKLRLIMVYSPPDMYKRYRKE